MNRRVDALLWIFLGLTLVQMSAKAAPAAELPPQFGAWGVDLSALDPQVKPGDNFFQFVNGSWLRRAQIPEDRSSTGSLQDLQILSEQRLRSIVGELAAKSPAELAPEQRKLRDLYDAYEDAAQIEARGLEPLRADLDYLAGLQSAADVARAMGSARLSILGVYQLEIGPDQKHPDRYITTISQSGLGLPDRDYYLGDDAAMVSTRDAYRRYLSAMLGLAGMVDADRRAESVFQLETAMARVEWPRADRRDVTKTYNRVGVRALDALAPGFPWDAYLSSAGISPTVQHRERVVIVAEQSAFAPLAAIFASTPVAVWRDYLTIHLLHSLAVFLPQRFDDADFALYGTVLGGRKVQLDRPTRGVRLLDRSLGEALGKLYVARYFPPEAKAKASALVSNLLKVYQQDIKVMPGMSARTRAKALAKVHQFTPEIGYPNRWRDYSGYSVDRDDLIGDIERASLFEWNHDLLRLDRRVDRTEWGMTPSTVNAYYNPVFNEVVFPAAILQPPFFDPNADEAVNYGGVGAVIGHEISHGFDDQGSKYDGHGVLGDWWTAEDRASFGQRTARLVEQFNAYEPLPGLHLNGANTLGENIADLAGLEVALKAYHLSLGGHAAPVLDGYGGDQRFFLAFGQIWRSKQRENALRTQILSNVHSPAEFRVIGPTRNLDEWYTAFGVATEDRYYLPPEQRVHLW